jgi:hypothetical protein
MGRKAAKVGFYAQAVQAVRAAATTAKLPRRAAPLTPARHPRAPWALGCAARCGLDAAAPALPLTQPILNPRRR